VLTEDLGVSWKAFETSFKWHASCRFTHPSADALIALMREEKVGPEDIQSLVALVQQPALETLGPAERGDTVHQVRGSTISTICQFFF
jgi:2-methylcitrate dehydratase PrpD